MPDDPAPQFAFTRGEIKWFRVYAVFLAAVAAGMFKIMPQGPMQTVGALIAVALLPVLPLAVYFRRRGRR